MALTPFATVEDLLEGWPNKKLNESEETAADALLERASAYIATKLARAGIEIDATDELQATNLKTVTVNVVRRSLSSADADGFSQLSQTIGSTTASVSFTNPEGAFWLSASDKDILGLTGTGGKIGWASLAGEA